MLSVTVNTNTITDIYNIHGRGYCDMMPAITTRIKLIPRSTTGMSFDTSTTHPSSALIYLLPVVHPPGPPNAPIIRFFAGVRLNVRQNVSSASDLHLQRHRTVQGQNFAGLQVDFVGVCAANHRWTRRHSVGGNRSTRPTFE